MIMMLMLMGLMTALSWEHHHMMSLSRRISLLHTGTTIASIARSNELSSLGDTLNAEEEVYSSEDLAIPIKDLDSDRNFFLLLQS